MRGLNAAAFGVALFAVSVASSVAGPAVAFDALKAVGIDQRPGAQIPLDVQFRDQAGRVVTLGDLAIGKPILLVPVLHHCPNICGVTLAGLIQAITAQELRPGRDFTLVAFGIDPAERPTDAAASLAQLKASFPRLQLTMTGLTGKAEDIAAITRPLGYRYAWDEASVQYAHLAATAVLTSTGRLTRWLYGVAPSPVDLSLALTEAGEGRIGGWADQILLLCYHYDPVNGRYDNMAWLAVQLGGCLIIAVAASLALCALLRQGRWKYMKPVLKRREARVRTARSKSQAEKALRRDIRGRAHE